MAAEAIETNRVAKDSMRRQWDEAAKGWSDSSGIIRAWLRETTRAMLGMAGIETGSRVLDVAAGAGDQTLDIAARVGPGGTVLATDLSPEILAFARRNADTAGYRNVETRVSDGEALAVEAASFDAVVCRLGLMLFTEPLQGLREMWRALKPGGGICTVVFSTPESNPCAGILVSTALKHVGQASRDPYQPGGLFSLGKPGLIDALFKQAGFTQIATTKMAAPFRLHSVKDYLDFARSSAAPIVKVLDGLDPAKRQVAWAEIEEKLGRFNTRDGWQGPNELLLTAARR